MRCKGEGQIADQRCSSTELLIAAPARSTSCYTVASSQTVNFESSTGMFESYVLLSTILKPAYRMVHRVDGDVSFMSQACSNPLTGLAEVARP